MYFKVLKFMDIKKSRKTKNLSISTYTRKKKTFERTFVEHTF